MFIKLGEMSHLTQAVFINPLLLYMAYRTMFPNCLNIIGLAKTKQNKTNTQNIPKPGVCNFLQKYISKLYVRKI